MVRNDEAGKTIFCAEAGELRKTRLSDDEEYRAKCKKCMFRKFVFGIYLKASNNKNSRDHSFHVSYAFNIQDVSSSVKASNNLMAEKIKRLIDSRKKPSMPELETYTSEQIDAELDGYEVSNHTTIKSSKIIDEECMSKRVIKRKHLIDDLLSENHSSLKIKLEDNSETIYTKIES